MTKPTGILSLPHFNDNFFRWPALAHRYQNVSILDVTGADADGGSGDNWSYSTCKKKISHRHYIGPLRGSSSLFSTLSRRGLNPIKPVGLCDPDQPDGRLNLTASAFNQLGQYTSSPGRRGYCNAELAVFFLLAVAVTTYWESHKF